MEVLLLKGIEEKEGYLVTLAEGAIDETEIYNDKEFGEAQLRNICNIAFTSSAIEVVKNFIKYQIGREKGGKGWKYKKNEETPAFGKKVLSDLDNIEKTHLEDICREASDKRREVMMHLTRLYFGYMARYYKFKKV